MKLVLLGDGMTCDGESYTDKLNIAGERFCVQSKKSITIIGDKVSVL